MVLLNHTMACVNALLAAQGLRHGDISLAGLNDDDVLGRYLLDAHNDMYSLGDYRYLEDVWGYSDYAPHVGEAMRMFNLSVEACQHVAEVSTEVWAYVTSIEPLVELFEERNSELRSLCPFSDSRNFN